MPYFYIYGNVKTLIYLDYSWPALSCYYKVFILLSFDVLVKFFSILEGTFSELKLWKLSPTFFDRRLAENKGWLKKIKCFVNMACDGNSGKTLNLNATLSY